MAEENYCPACGTPMRAGESDELCLKCLMEHALEPQRQAGVEAMDAAVALADDGAPLDSLAEHTGRYTGERELAMGGMGRILVAHDAYLGRDVAIKELLPEAPEPTGPRKTPSPVWNSTPAAARFFREARVTGQLEHPSIVPVHEMGHRQDGTLYYTMKLIRGRSLSQAISEAGPAQARLQLVPHFLDLCQAVSYAHSRGVIHCDIKPANIMIGEFGETMLLDWGLAKVYGKEDIFDEALQKTAETIQTGKEPDGAQTAGGKVLGTPIYMAPEQARGESDKIGPRSDVYALGAVLYTILTGRPPFQGERSSEILAKVTKGKLKPVLDSEPGAPRELASICHRAMALDPGERYPSAKELADEIQQYLSGGLVHAYDYRFSEHMRRFLNRFRAVLATAAAALVLLLVGGVYSYAQVLEEKNMALAAQKDAEDGRRRIEREEYYRTIPLAAAWLDQGRHVEVAALLRRAPRHLRGWEWGHLMSRTRVEERRVRAHARSLGGMALGGDKKWLVSISDTTAAQDSGESSGEVVAHRAADLEEAWRVQLPQRTLSVAVSSAEGIAAVGVWDGPLYILDLEDGEVLHELPAEESCWDLCFSPGGARLFGQCESQAFVPSGSVSRTRDRTVFTWSTEDWSVLDRTAVKPCRGRTGLACSRDGRLVAFGDDAGNIAVRDAERGTDVAAFEGGHGRIKRLAFDANASKLLSADASGTVCVWDLQARAKEPLLELALHEKQIASLEIAADNRHFVSGSVDGELKLIQLEDGRVLGGLYAGGALGDARCEFEEGRLYAASKEGAISDWSVDTAFGLQPVETPFEGLAGTGTRIRFSQDGLLFLGCRQAQGQIDLWETESFELVSSQTVEDLNLNKVTFVEGTHQLHVPNPAMAYSVGSLAEDDRLAVLGASALGNLNLDDSMAVLRSLVDVSGEWDIEPRRLLDVNLPSNAPLLPIGVTSGDKTLAVTGLKGMLDVAVTTVPGGDLLFETGGHLGGTRAITFHPEDNVFAVGDSYGYVYLWSANTAEMQSMFQAHGGEITALNFSPDGLRLLSAGMDKTVRLWDWTTGQQVLIFDDLNDYARDAMFSPDGSLIAFTDKDPPFRLYRSPS